ncbi:hypothetical protein ANN_17111 [Periplaneta americana]|uniref:Uncharacterized protein n=1 Tax=Periplaneta americana TaxID=6978 RepID=A0ABQ8SS08_PERAM|nr:hypothetical protein ANN_17111 [Periplaneta americana]
MAGLCEGGNEPPGSLKANKRLPADLELRSGAGSIPALADYLVGFFPRFSPIPRLMSVDDRRNFISAVYNLLLFDLRAQFSDPQVDMGTVIAS